MNDDDIELIPDPPQSEILINTVDNNTIVETNAPTIHLKNLDTFSPFLARIRRMNEVMGLPVNDVPTNLGEKRLDDFYNILMEEIHEIHDCKNLVDVADVLGDLIVFIASEAQKWGIPLIPVLHAIMDSQDTKLVDGKATYDERGKFLKGPNFLPPEDRIKEILESCQGD